MGSRILLSKEEARMFYKSESQAEKQINLRENWFPVLTSPELSGIVSDLMCDGHLQYGLWRLDYCSKNKSELRRFENSVKREFGLSGKIRDCSTNIFSKTFLLGINNKLFSRIMWRIGVPAGSKVIQRYRVPEWIVENKKCFKEFVRRYFSCEGTVSLEGGNSFIEVCMAKSVDVIDSGFEFLNQIKSGLREHFSIETMNVFTSGNNRSGTVNLKLRIKNAKYLKLFSEEVGFGDKRKQNKLEKALKLKGAAQKGQ